LNPKQYPCQHYPHGLLSLRWVQAEFIPHYFKADSLYAFLALAIQAISGRMVGNDLLY